MRPDEHILEVALAAVADEITHYPDLVDHCLTHTELGKLAETLDDDPAEYLADVLAESDLIRITDADEVIRIDLLLDGLVFTRRLTEHEIAGDMVELIPDLAAIDLDAPPDLEVMGGAVTIEFDWGDDPHLSEHGSLVGPSGWLEGFAPGELVAFRRQGTRLLVEPVGAVGNGDDEAEAIAAAFDYETAHGEGPAAEPGYVLERVLIEHPGLFRRPVPPVTDLLAAAGCEIEGAWVGRAGEDWMSQLVSGFEDLRSRLRSEYQLNDCCEDALADVIAAWSVGDEIGDLKPVNRALGHGAVIEAFCDWADEVVGLEDESIGDLATKLASSGRHDAAPALMLRARHVEVAGDAPSALLDLEDAVRIDPDFGPALAELAWYTSDGGDAPRTVSLLRRAGVGEDDPMLAFHAGLGADLPAVGRNQPCPCGSGRKYKACHLGQSEIPVEQRVTWLISKLTTFVTRPTREARLFGLASSAMLPDFEIIDLMRMSRDEFIVELAVFEGGGVSEFLDARGTLLPDGERDVLELWETARLRLWEVVGTDGHTTMAVRDTKTGETLEVADRSSAREFQLGEQILARFLPGWGRVWASGVSVRVDLGQRDSMLGLLDHDPDADLIADWYGGLFAPPSFTNREQEPLVLCEARLRPLNGWSELTTLLDAAYKTDDTEPGLWRELLEVGPEERILRATLRREEDELVIEVNSEARLERVLTGLADAAEVVTQTVQPVRNPTELKAMTGATSPAPPTEPPDPETIEPIVDMLERRWLDEEVPALGGMTPRQAADDPTRREDLVALLRTFDRMASGVGMTFRPDVLRRHLGLEE